jgi:hypothetical protein
MFKYLTVPQVKKSATNHNHEKEREKSLLISYNNILQFEP